MKINTQKIHALIHKAITAKETSLQLDDRDSPLIIRHESDDFDLYLEVRLGDRYELLEIEGALDGRTLTWDFFTVEETDYMIELVNKLDLRYLFDGIEERENVDWPPRIKWGF